MAKAKAKTKTRTPTGNVSGLKISRNGGDIIFEWKQPKVWYTAWQKAWWSDSTVYNTKNRWGVLKVSKGAEKRVSTWGTSSYFPNTSKKLTYVGICLQGKANDTSTNIYTPSGYVYGWYYFYKPKTPSVTTEVQEYPQTAFKWSVANSDAKSQYWYHSVKIWTVLIRDCSITDGNKINWSKNYTNAHTRYNGGSSQAGTKYEMTTTATSGTFTVQEDAGLLNDGHSYTRWFCICSRGPAGQSSYVYRKHVYGLPNQCTITRYILTKNTDENGYTAQIYITAPYSAQQPTNKVVVEYAIDTPDDDMECPTNPGWQEGATVLLADTTIGATFSIDSIVGEDQCLFVRANSVYDERVTHGVPQAIDFGKLAEPDNLSVLTNQSTYTATITADNESSVPDSFLVVRYMTEDDPNGFDIGIIPNGQTSVTIQCPEWVSAPRFGVYAAAPAWCYETVERDDGITTYEVTPTMKSGMVTDGGSIPEAPEISAAPTNISGTIRVSWNWAWAEADGAELSWANHADAWESTDEPDTYEVTKLNAAAWNISGLQTGEKWYVRVRLFKGNDDTRTFGAYSETVVVDLASAPLTPALSLSPAVITNDGQVTASWVYSTTDGTAQAFAEVAEVTEEDGETVYTPITQTETAQHVTISAQEQGWDSGESHTLACRVVSASGRQSDGWSNGVTVSIAEPISCEITQTSLETVTVYYEDDDGEQVGFNELALTEMPMTVTVEGAGDYGQTTLSIERAATYHVDRPDETDLNGFEGETIFTTSQIGESQITINLEDLIGRLDDSAPYRIVATVQDGVGQTASATLDFDVRWAHQPNAPTAIIEAGDDFDMVLTPIAPAGAALTDVCDIYRLSIDKPKLVYQSATFGEKYVDPYPTIGEFGGYRFVTRTANGDYITDGVDQGSFAWTDYAGGINTRYNIIDFGGDRVFLELDVELSSQFEKSFRQTKYLGGSVQGDWNTAIGRNGTVSFTAIDGRDDELIQSMRRLAAYAGLCHVRTRDGSSYPANVSVSETYNYATGVKKYDYSLTITGVDPEQLDGIPYEDESE